MATSQELFAKQEEVMGRYVETVERSQQLMQELVDLGQAISEKLAEENRILVEENKNG